MLCGCNHSQSPPKGEYRVGDRVAVGPLTYTVIETRWRSQLEAFPAVRFPGRNFLLVRISVTNGGGTEISVPLLKLENSNGDSYNEDENGSGVDNWLGLLRRMSPAQTADGFLLFDVPTNSYHLRVTNGDVENEKAAFISMPLRVPD
jgi:hypothetical protein